MIRKLLLATAVLASLPALAQQMPGPPVNRPVYLSNATVTSAQGVFAVSTIPAPYTSATVLDFRAFSSIILDCPTAPSAIVFNVSPDAANAANVGTTSALINPIALTAVQNNAASGLVVTSTGAAIAEWSVTGNKFAAFMITGGACWISGSNS